MRRVSAARGKASRPTKRSLRRSKEDIMALSPLYKKFLIISKTQNSWIFFFLSHLGSAERQSCVKPTGTQRLQRRPPWFCSAMLFASPSATQHWTAWNCPDPLQNTNRTHFRLTRSTKRHHLLLTLKRQNLCTNQNQQSRTRCQQNLKRWRWIQLLSMSCHCLSPPAPLRPSVLSARSRTKKMCHLSHYNLTNLNPQQSLQPHSKNNRLQEIQSLKSNPFHLRLHNRSLTPHSLYTPHRLYTPFPLLHLYPPDPSPCWQPSPTASPGAHSLDTNLWRWGLHNTLSYQSASSDTPLFHLIAWPHTYRKGVCCFYTSNSYSSDMEATLSSLHKVWVIIKVQTSNPSDLWCIQY